MRRSFLFLSLAALVLLGAGCTRRAAVIPSVDIIEGMPKPRTPFPIPTLTQSAITAENQPVRNFVNIANVQLTESAFVVVHEDDGGKPGKVIGKNGPFKAGVYTVTVTLDRLPKAGERLYAMLHDASNTPLKDAKGALLMSTFVVTQ